MLTLRYGNRPLAITGDKSTIEIGTLDKLPKIIDTIIEAVKAGELDKQLNAVSPHRRIFRTEFRLRPFAIVSRTNGVPTAHPG